jgi:hypothetical protein
LEVGVDRDDDFVTVEELPELLRSYGLSPTSTPLTTGDLGHQRAVPAAEARSLMSAFVRHPGHPDQKVHGRRKKFGKLVPDVDVPGGDAAAKARREKAARARLAKQLTVRLAAGERFDAEPDVVADMFTREITPDSPPMNLALMGVRGEGNENLFNKPLRDIPRDQMPALPDTVAGLIPMIQELGRMGVKVDLVDNLDPREIKPVQTELSAPKVAKLAGYMREGWKPGGAMIISRENGLGDGHHRWAGAAVAAMLHQQGVKGYKPVGVTALKVDLPIDDLLAVMEKFSGPKKSINEKPA